MNYGKDFIELYNKYFSVFKKEIIARIKEDHDSPEMEKDLHRTYKNEIQGKINEIRKNDSKGEKSSSLTGISLGYMNKEYKSDRIENIVNRDIYNYFQSNQQYTQYKDFNHFIQLYSKFLVLHNYSSFLTENYEDFYTFLKKEKIKDFFKTKYIENDLNILVLDKEKTNTNEKLLLEKSLTTLTSKEKMILLHVLFHQFKDSGLYNLSMEYFRVLALCSDCLKEGDIYNAHTNNTLFNYFNKGIGLSTKTKKSKAEDINIIQNKIIPIKGIQQFKYALEKYKNSL